MLNTIVKKDIYRLNDFFIAIVMGVLKWNLYPIMIAL